MINQAEMAHRWHEVAGRLRERFPLLTADDIHAFNGNVDEMIAKIAHLTGEQPAQVRQVVEEALGLAASVKAKAADVAAKAVSGARDSFENVRAGSQQVVSHYPVESILSAFALGLVSGIATALLIRERPQPSTFDRFRGYSNDLARQIADRIGELDPAELKKFVGR